MSVKYFGEFLVQKGVIKSEDLVLSLIEQISKQPPLCQIVFDLKLITSEKMMDVFRRQQDQKSDFITSCQDLGYWNDEIEKKVQSSLSDVRMPLGQILVNRGSLDLKTLTHMLDEFLSQAEVQESSPDSLPRASFTAQTQEAALEVPGVEEDIEYQPAMIMEIEDLFDDRKRKVIKVALSFIKDKSSSEEQVVHKLFQDSLKIIHTINGLTMMLGVKHISRLLTLSEDILHHHLKANSSPEKHQEVADVLYRSFEEAWKIRNSLIEQNTEKNHFTILANKKSFQERVNELEMMLGKVQ